MNQKTIDGLEVYEYVVNGAKEIIRNEAILNKINVFPIADGDTGSNLAYTMKNLISGLSRQFSFSDTIKQAAEIMMEDSYGNSGTIMASYFSGLAYESQNKEKVTLGEFAGICGGAVSHAYESVAEPVEGTILTVIAAWSQSLIDNHTSVKTKRELLELSLKHSSDVLKKTKEQISVLKKANVVDAGALGFLYFVSGMLKNSDVNKIDYVASMNVLDHSHKDSNHRFCTELTLEAKQGCQIDALKEKLKNMGDSLIIKGGKDYIKIHCHTGDPMILSSICKDYGHIIKVKVDDMILQESFIKKEKSPIAIITDSIGDYGHISDSQTKVVTIPIHLLVNGSMYLDRVTIDPRRLYDEMDKSATALTTAQPSDAIVEKTLTHLLDHFDYIIGLTVSSKMSGFFQKLKRIGQATSKDRIKIIDSKTNSGAQGLMLREIINRIENNEPFESIVSSVNANLDSYKIFVQIPDLKYAAKSGRVPKLVYNFAKFFKIQVIISVDENGHGIVAKKTDVVKHLIKKMKRNQVLRYGVIHSDNHEEASKIGKILTETSGFEPEFIECVSSVVAGLVGLGAVGIAYEEANDD